MTKFIKICDENVLSKAFLLALKRGIIVQD